jgi:hypothetical protein
MVSSSARNRLDLPAPEGAERIYSVPLPAAGVFVMPAFSLGG